MRETLIGASINRLDAYEKVTGKAQYVDDINFSGMLYAKMIVSTKAHARIKKIDTSAAAKLSGVHGVLTGADLDYKVGLYMIDKDVLAKEKVRYVGEPVACVCAEDEITAVKAAHLVEVEYEPLPFVLNVEEALKDDAPLVHENLEHYNYIKGVFNPIPNTNIANHFKIRRGDIKKGFQEADHIVENKFELPQVQHVPLETHVCIGQWVHDGKLKVWTSAQSPFAVRNLLSVSFKLPHEAIEVIVPYVGGGFGGKAGIHLEPLVLCLSRIAKGRPVKLCATRQEEFMTIPVRQGLLSKIKTGIKQKGTIVAMEISYLWDAGAYADYGVNIGRASGYSGAGPYRIENIKLDSLTIYTNKPFGTAYRGFGHVEIHWAIERQMDLLAQTIKMCPLKFRQLNALKAGDYTITGEKITASKGRVDICLEKVAAGIDFTSPKASKDLKGRGKVRAKGIAALQKAPAMPPNTGTACLIKFNEDGSIKILLSLIDYGQGTYTALAQIAAEKLKIPLEKVHLNWETTTAKDPYDWQTVASKGLFLSGNAVIAACEDLIMQMKEVAAQVLRASPQDLELGLEKVFLKNDPLQYLAYKDLALGYTYDNGNAIGGPLMGRGKYIAQGLTNLNKDTGEGLPALDWTYGAHGVEIELDLLTGELTVLKICSAFDLGKIINYKNCVSQIHGGVVQGYGTAVMEEYVYDQEGRLINSNLTDYKIPTIKDIPYSIEAILVETPELTGPYGARGVAEHPMISVSSAIGNALGSLGLDLFDGPLTSERIYFSLVKARKNK